MERANKLTEAVTQMTSLHNANRLAARSTADPENSDNAVSGEDDEENDRRNRVTMHETDSSLYNETNLATSFLSHQETSLSSVATAGKPKDDPMIPVIKEFSESYNQANENWREATSEEVTKVVSDAFKEILSEAIFKNLLTKVTMLKNCKFSQVKLVRSVVFASASPSIRSADKKLQEVWCNMSKMTGCLIKLLSQFLNILKTNGNHEDEKLEVIQTILDGIKMSGYATQNLVLIGENSYYLLLVVNTRIWLSFRRTLTLIYLGKNQKTP